MKCRRHLICAWGIINPATKKACAPSCERPIAYGRSSLGPSFPSLSGTGINYQIIDEFLGSSHVKAQPYVRLHDIGVFDDGRSQAAYISLQRCFKPLLGPPSSPERGPGFVDGTKFCSSLGNITDNIFYRYRTTAALILLLICEGCLGAWVFTYCF